MSASTTPDRPLAETLAAARAHADRHFGEGAPPEWQPSGAATPGRWPQRPRGAWGAAGLLAATVVLAVGGWASRLDTAEVPATEVTAAPPEVDPVDHEDVESPRPLPTGRTPPPAATMPSAPVLNITRRGPLWQIHAVDASRLAAAQVLAELSGSTLHGGTALLAAARPLVLHRWQGRSPAQAWRAVLGDEVNHALQCDTVRCQVWIVSGGAPGAALPLAAVWPTAAAALPAAGMAPAAAATAPSDSDDPRISSHHD